MGAWSASALGFHVEVLDVEVLDVEVLTRLIEM